MFFSNAPISAKRRPRLWWLLAATSVICLLAPLGSSATAATRSRPTVVPSQRRVAIMFAPHTAFRAPRLDSRAMAQLPVHQPITGERTTLPVDASTTTADGTRWLKVMLPGRPNGSTGWIRAWMTRTAVTPWHLLVDLGARTLTVYLNGRPQRTFRAVVGKPSTPTPTGSYFVQETLAMPPNTPGGPYALALSARSNVLREFDGGPGQIAVHGRDYYGGTLGAAQSHGCIRLATSSITWLAQRIGPGVPVTIDAH